MMCGLKLDSGLEEEEVFLVFDEGHCWGFIVVCSLVHFQKDRKKSETWLPE
jgi:hypothetical protein